MKKIIMIMLLVCLSSSLINCSRVEPGQVGIKVHLLGGSKGINHDVLGVGKYWIGMNEKLYTFPTFQQTYVWTADKAEGSLNDESITFQTKDGLSIGADIGITYHIEKSTVGKVFEKYRKGVDELTDIVLRNMVRDAFVRYAVSYDAEQAYSTHKRALIDSVNVHVKRQAIANGVNVEKIYYIGSMRLPKQVIGALNAKIKAIQTSQRIENEVRSARAEAEKKIATAEGEARSILLKAEAQAKANKLLNSSISVNLIKYEQVKKWDGQMPKVTSGNALIDLR